MKLLRKLIIALVFRGQERSYYLEALNLKETKSKVLHAAKRWADEKNLSDGKRYYILDTYGVTGEFTILNSLEIDAFKKNGKIRKDLTFHKLASIASYQTK